ncbi:MAG: hypothetical protein AAB388_03755 [Patescibacteria group bacterium]
MKKFVLAGILAMTSTAALSEGPRTTMNVTTPSALAFTYADGRTEFVISEFQKDELKALDYAISSNDIDRSSVWPVSAGVVVVALKRCAIGVEPSAYSCRITIWPSS